MPLIVSIANGTARLYNMDILYMWGNQMSKAANAALLSALVLPGAGHYFLKRYLRGTLLAGAALVSLYVVAYRIVERALEIAEKIRVGEVQFDVTAIAEILSIQPAGTESQLLRLAWIVLIVSWLIGIADSYRLGLMQGKNVVSDS